MSEIAFCRAFLSALDSRPAKFSSDHIADARQYSPGAFFVLPRLPHPPHPQRPNPKTDTSVTSSSTLKITLKPLKPASPILPFTDIDASKTSVFDLKQQYSTTTEIPAAKIKLLYKKKPVADSKTLFEVIGSDAGSEIEFGVMVLGGHMGGAGTTPVSTPPATILSEAEKGITVDPAVPAAQGPIGKEVIASEEFWEDLEKFVLQRIRDEKEGKQLVEVFKTAWEQQR